MKTRKGNDVIDSTGVVYTESEIEVSWLIRLGVIYDKNQIGQQHDRSHTYAV